MVFYSLLYFAGVCAPYGLSIASHILLQSQGLFDCLVYGGTHKRFREKFHGLRGILLKQNIIQNLFLLAGLLFALATPFLVIPIIVLRVYKFCCTYYYNLKEEQGLQTALINTS